MTTPSLNNDSRKNETDLIQIRRTKGEHWRDFGFEPYGTHVNIANTRIGHLLEMWSYRKGEEDGGFLENRVYTVSGRITSIRGQGGVRFLNLEDQGSKIQLFVSKKEVFGPDYWNIFQYFDIGDIIEVSGKLMLTTSGEFSIRVHSVTPITKSLIGSAKSGAGTVDDAETKYRQRYRDLIENQSSREVFIARSAIIRAMRDFMEDRGSMEVETPILTTLRSGANATPFETHHNTLDKDLYLRIAPELYLKRLLVGGFQSVFEIGRLFRNEGISTRHNPEFTALEYYQVGADYKTLIATTKEMLQYIAAIKNTGYSTSDPKFTVCEFKEVSMYEITQIALGTFHNFVFNLQVENDQSNWKEVRESLENNLIDVMTRNAFCSAVKGSRSAGEFLYACYELFAEPRLTELFRGNNGTLSVPVFVTDYPVEVSPLAKRHSEQNQNVPGVILTQRFELFIEGKEVANAFTELNDPDEQAQRFNDQIKNRAAGDHEAMDMDEDYIKALMFGLPSCAGLGVGVDRLVMLFTNQSCIRDVILFPTMR